ncbi:MAG: sensor histidine kinase, partial [Candidatus Kapaibacterium sp.]
NMLLKLTDRNVCATKASIYQFCSGTGILACEVCESPKKFGRTIFAHTYFLTAYFLIAMKKRSIWTILALMSIALLGVIAVQVYWLARAAHLEERLFKERVNQAMERVARQLEAREMKAHVMKSLSDVRRTVNDAKAQQFKIITKNSLNNSVIAQHRSSPSQFSSARASKHAHQSKQTPADSLNVSNTSTKQFAAETTTSGALSSNTSPNTSSGLAPNTASAQLHSESGSFEMRIGSDGTFSFQSSRTQSVRPVQPPAPDAAFSVPAMVITVPSESQRSGQPVRIRIPQRYRSTMRNDSLAERIRSRFANVHKARNCKNCDAQERTQNYSTGALSTSPQQPYIGGRKTLEDRMNGVDERRQAEYFARQAQREAVQFNVQRSLRDLERLRRLNLMNPHDMRSLDSTFNVALRQAVQDFGGFGFEFRVPPNAVMSPAPPAPSTPNVASEAHIAASQDSTSLAAKSPAAKRAQQKAERKHLSALAANASNHAAYQARSLAHSSAYSSAHSLAHSSAKSPTASTSTRSSIEKDTIEKIIDRVDLVENIMENMLSGKRTMSERVSLNDVDSLLRNELHSTNITENFEYGIVRGGMLLGSNRGNNAQNTRDYTVQPASYQGSLRDSVMVVQSFKRKTDDAAEYAQAQTVKTVHISQTPLLSSKYRARLFPNDLFNTDEYYLVVRFPEYAPGLSLAGIGAEVSLSAVFLLMIIGCFGFTFVALQKQKKLSDMKTDFINNMTHELKTPIATISIASEALKDDHVRSEAVRVERFVHIIHDENKRLAGHVEKVLQAAQMDRGELKLNLQNTDVHTLLETAAESLSLQLEQKQGSVELHLEATQPSIYADEAHLMNMIFNLLDNANKYTPEKPHLVVRTRNTAQGLAFTIQDNGIGMTREAQKHIFEKFYRVPTGNRHDVKGFGLGLNYVQTIVEAHGGSISVKSELGKGSTFEVILPLQTASRQVLS